MEVLGKKLRPAQQLAGHQMPKVFQFSRWWPSNLLETRASASSIMVVSASDLGLSVAPHAAMMGIVPTRKLLQACRVMFGVGLLGVGVVSRLQA